MKSSFQIAFIVLFVSCISIIASADRGGFGRKRTKVNLNITTSSTLKNSIAFNLRSGLIYRGSSLISHHFVGKNSFDNALVTYKKGNTIYILPYKQRILISDYSPSGYKLIIRSK
ncbi:MAG: hypothetical protein ABJA57_02660 [Ginsengibacter sp.]